MRPVRRGTSAVLRERREIAAGTVELTFVPDEEVRFEPGQYCRLDLAPLRWPDRKSSRKLSIVNAPFEQGRLDLATRQGVTGYKRSLDALEVGDRARIERVKGDLVLPSSPRRPISMVAGGIGVAPFVSMLRHLEHRDELRDVRMLYLNRSRASAAYLDELSDLAARRPGFRFVPVMTRDPDWVGEQRRLAPELLEATLGDPKRFEHFVVGTPRMVTAAVDALALMGVPRRRVHEEDFSGYSPPDPGVQPRAVDVGSTGLAR